MEYPTHPDTVSVEETSTQRHIGRFLFAAASNTTPTHRSEMTTERAFGPLHTGWTASGQCARTVSALQTSPNLGSSA